MNKKKVFIDGAVGTTGLEISEILESHSGLELVKVSDEDRKNDSVRLSAAKESDLVILCLPDEASKEAAQRYSVINGLKILDASSAHRTAPGWVYGLPELGAGQKAKISEAAMVSNPGCYASCLILLCAPVFSSLPAAKHPEFLFVSGISGYSGGGKKLIDQFENQKGFAAGAFYDYSMGKAHKHIPEMSLYSGFQGHILFSPAVVNTYRGLEIKIGIAPGLISTEKIYEAWEKLYSDSATVHINPLNSDKVSFHGITTCNGKLAAEVGAFETESGIILRGVIDNLGMGAALNALRNMNLMLGFPEFLQVPLKS